MERAPVLKPSNTQKGDFDTITQPTLTGEQMIPPLSEDYIQTAKSEALTPTAVNLETIRNLKYQPLSSTKEDITGKKVFNSSHNLLFTISENNPVIYGVILNAKQIEANYRGEDMQQIYLLTRAIACQDVSSLSKIYNPELDDKIRSMLLYYVIKKTSNIDISLIQGAIQEGNREYFYPWVEANIAGLTARIDFHHLPIDKQTNQPANITTFTPDEEGYQNFIGATGGFSIPIHEQPTQKVAAVNI